jgi:hypothetical protein
MTGINLNLQNSYTALYSNSATQTNTRPGNLDAGTAQGASPAGSGEKLTLSAEAIALSLQTDETTIPNEEALLGGGAGIRPPEVTTLGGGAGIRPPLAP